MPTETLQRELLAVPGVAAAEMDIVEGALPAGVKVSLSPNADAHRVGIEVQRVLAAHGMRSRFSSGDADPSTGGTEARSISQGPERAEPPSGVPLSDVPDSSSATTSASPAQPLSPAPIAAHSERVPVSEVRSVSVEERPDGLTVSAVLADGRQASRAIGHGPEELENGVIAAIAEASGVAVTRVAVEWSEAEGESIVTVVVKRADDSLAAGAGVVQSGRAFAVGIATRSALDS